MGSQAGLSDRRQVPGQPGDGAGPDRRVLLLRVARGTRSRWLPDVVPGLGRPSPLSRRPGARLGRGSRRLLPVRGERGRGALGQAEARPAPPSRHRPQQHRAGGSWRVRPLRRGAQPRSGRSRAALHHGVPGPAARHERRLPRLFGRRHPLAGGTDQPGHPGPLRLREHAGLGPRVRPLAVLHPADGACVRLRAAGAGLDGRGLGTRRGPAPPAARERGGEPRSAELGKGADGVLSRRAGRRLAGHRSLPALLPQRAVPGQRRLRRSVGWAFRPAPLHVESRRLSLAAGAGPRLVHPARAGGPLRRRLDPGGVGAGAGRPPDVVLLRRPAAADAGRRGSGQRRGTGQAAARPLRVAQGGRRPRIPADARGADRRQRAAHQLRHRPALPQPDRHGGAGRHPSRTGGVAAGAAGGGGRPAGARLHDGRLRRDPHQPHRPPRDLEREMGSERAAWPGAAPALSPERIGAVHVRVPRRDVE